MSFLEWTFLFGVAAVAGPIIAHMLAKPRFKRIPFTMIEFLRTSKSESHSRRNLKDIIILLLRSVAVILLAILFAQPVLNIEPEQKETNHVYYLGLDNSASMQYTDGRSSNFQRLKDTAIEYIVAAEPDSVFNICPLSTGTWIRDVTKQQAIAEVKALKIAFGNADIDTFISGINNSSQALKPEIEVSACLVSDFTPAVLNQFFNVSEAAVVDSLEYKVIKSDEAISNASIIKCNCVEKVSNRILIDVTVANYGQTHQQRRLLAATETGKPEMIDIDLAAGELKSYPIQVDLDSNNSQRLFIPIEFSLEPIITANPTINRTGDFFEYDDKFYLSIRVPQQRAINILLVEDKEDQMFLIETAVKSLSSKSTDKLMTVKTIKASVLDSEQLNWANVVVCSGITNRMVRMVPNFTDFTEKGGRIIFFLTDDPDTLATNRLSKAGLLPARPDQLIEKITYPEINPAQNDSIDIDKDAAKALVNYRLDKIPVYSYWNLTQSSENSTCLWKYSDGTALILYKEINNGECILINTSSDGSMGAITKSSASVALCKYLLGNSGRMQDYSYSFDGRVVLPIADLNITPAQNEQFMILGTNGVKEPAILSDSAVFISQPEGPGWLKTISEPVIYAGINLPEGEINLSKPSEQEIEDAINRVFSTEQRDSLAALDALMEKQQRPVWSILVWIIIVLLLVETALANRLKR